ncbi:MAG: hypothetical protein U5L45_21975 [Saprospiraceae bacterium]|nr:hypothetical protein [Saprospiraceae bacterium]
MVHFRGLPENEPLFLSSASEASNSVITYHIKYFKYKQLIT